VLTARYLKNSHGPTHTAYRLEIMDVFKVQRDVPFASVGNRKLLWHGSRLTNWAGILGQVRVLLLLVVGCFYCYCCKRVYASPSFEAIPRALTAQGLRIAPPEAPTTGYM
jgi:hypothetical protein